MNGQVRRHLHVDGVPSQRCRSSMVGTQVNSADYYHPTDFEQAAGWVHGLSAPLPVKARTLTPLEALADVLRPALANPPCYVAFSGGRDSSAILAVATTVARCHNLPDPVPVTQAYPDLPEVNEEEWQRAVLEHLGLRDWVRVEVRQENDLLSPAAKASLRARGLLWPPAVHNKVNLLNVLSRGTLLTGEGGDEVFGARRVTAWPHLRKGTTVPRRRAISGAVSSLMPQRLRRSRALTRLQTSNLQPWLRSPMREEHLRLLARDEASEPLLWAHSLGWLARKRSAVVLSQNYSALAAEHGVRLSMPLLEPSFLTALGRTSPYQGFPGRTAAMRFVFGDLLPPSVIGRSSKANFIRAFMGPATRAFAEQWDGSGVREEWVDIPRLRQEWLSDRPSALSSTLLHAAWLHSGAEPDP